MQQIFDWNNFYQIVDIAIKLTAGIVIVIFLNNRNNNIKKKEILYNLFLNFIECYQLIYDKMHQSIRHEIFNTLKRNNWMSEIDYIGNYLDKYIIESRQDYNDTSSKIFEMFRLSETIELILGINTKRKYWNKLKLDYMDALRQPSFDKRIPDFNEFYDTIISYIKNYHLNNLTEGEVRDYIELEINSKSSSIFTDYYMNKKVVKIYIDEIYKKINKL